MTTDQHLNTGAMALGALPDDEAGDYADHLQSCPTCASELTSFRQTAAILGSSVAQTPPASLRRSVMAAVAQTAQLPPLTDELLGRHRSPAPEVVADDEVVQDSGPVLATVIPLRRPWYRRPQSLLAAAVALLVIAGGSTFALTRTSSGPHSADACVAAAPDRSIQKPTVGAGGTVTVAGSCDTAIVRMPSVPAPPAGKSYQLWVLSGSKPTSAGLMTKQADGSYAAVNASVHVGDTAVAVTVEPAGGSPTPTTAPFWVVPLSA